MWLQTVRRKDLDDPWTRLQMRTTVAHEFGHVLGLKHVKPSKCALMAPSGPTGCRPAPAAWQIRCRLLQADDVRGAVARYGGRVLPLGQDLCDLYGPPLPVSALAVSYDPAGEVVRATWTNADFPKRHTPVAAMQRDTCPADPAAAFAPYPGDTESSFQVSDGPGTYCVSVWAQDEFGRFSAPVTATVEVLPPPPEEL